METKLFIVRCIFASTSHGQECREPLGKCQGMSHCLKSGHPVNPLKLFHIFTLLEQQMLDICIKCHPYTLHWLEKLFTTYGIQRTNYHENCYIFWRYGQKLAKYTRCFTEVIFSASLKIVRPLIMWPCDLDLWLFKMVKSVTFAKDTGTTNLNFYSTITITYSTHMPKTAIS